MLPASLAEARKAQIAPAKALHASDLGGALGFASLHTVLGAGLGMLFAPKAGSELRNQISEQAGNLANAATDQYQRATEAASGWADRGKEVYDKTRDVIAKGADEAQRYVKDATGAAKDWSSSGSSGGSSYGSGPSSEHTRGSAPEQTGGSHSTGGGSRRS